MTDMMGQTPEVRRQADPFDPMTQTILAPMGDGNADPSPQSAPDISTPGTPLPSRPDRAAANNRRYGGGSETATPTIPEPCG